jgi:hypothetical protein
MGDLRLAAGFQHLAAHDLAAAGTAAASRAAVGNRHAVAAHCVEQVGAGVDIELASEGLHDEFHGWRSDAKTVSDASIETALI